MARQQRLEPSVAGARRDQTLPGADRLLDRGERATEQDRARDHAAAGQLAIQHQVGAESEDGDLDEQAQELGAADHDGATVACLRVPLEGAIIIGMPAPQERRQHTHGVHHLGVAQRRLTALLGGHPALVGLAQRRAHDDFAGQRERKQKCGAEQCQHAEPRVQQPDHRDENQRPRRIENRKDTFAAEEGAQLGDIAQRLSTDLRARQALRPRSPRAPAPRGADRARC